MSMYALRDLKIAVEEIQCTLDRLAESLSAHEDGSESAQESSENHTSLRYVKESCFGTVPSAVASQEVHPLAKSSSSVITKLEKQCRIHLKLPEEYIGKQWTLLVTVEPPEQELEKSNEDSGGQQNSLDEKVDPQILLEANRDVLQDLLDSMPNGFQVHRHTEHGYMILSKICT